ncbi:response regulator transcription factor [Actinoallomurus spadix]|uniref:Response regulator transcription factor n=1 Tax=Actinoallomurus spadix TaxID=79912 RepID=A0ABN0WSP8_9ACTN|nr:response regulator transcription factor [Actinoallomurus spadix]MCO5990145.1 response regulator transcription factor [Actinoallomurus spadix]
MCAYILVAEDDPKQAELVRRYLRREEHSVRVVADGRSAVDEVRRDRPDLLVLDVMMPELDGLDVCRVLRREYDLPVLMVTARAGADDKLLGFDLGADDYLTKPYDPRELMARVRSLLRRSQRAPGPAAAPPLRVGNLTVDALRHEVRVGGRAVACTPAEFRILSTLMAAPGQVFSRRRLLENAYGLDGYITERTIDVHVMNLRKKVEQDPRRPAYLRTVYGVGYKIVDGRHTGD